MSRGPRRSETKYSIRPSDDQTGLWLVRVLSVTDTGALPFAGITTIALAAVLPKLVPSLMKSELPETQAISLPPDDQLQECRSRPFATARVVPALALKIASESPRVNATSRPSGDHAAERTGVPVIAGISGRAAPPSAGAVNTPPPPRKRIVAPSRDQPGRGLDHRRGRGRVS